MKIWISTLMALTLALVLSGPALAGDGQDDTITKTFKLTLYGDVPAAELFAVGYATREQLDNGSFPDPVPYILFCGTLSPGDDRPTQVVTDGSCKGGHGTTYTATVEFERGAELAYFFVRASNADPNLFDAFLTTPINEELKPTAYETLSDDATNAAYYRYGAAEEPMPKMPTTGAGGMADSYPPFAGAAAILGLLAAGTYTARRRM
ncbi:MAG: hypothetical protein M3P51_13700 [Chloroflexota bacterium]|nr:hypothetical protein [Chloroflexota bacterium]